MGEPKTTRAEHRYPLRPSFTAELVLPRDLTTEEAHALCALVMSIAPSPANGVHVEAGQEWETVKGRRVRVVRVDCDQGPVAFAACVVVKDPRPLNRRLIGRTVRLPITTATGRLDRRYQLAAPAPSGTEVERG